MTPCFRFFVLFILRANDAVCLALVCRAHARARARIPSRMTPAQADINVSKSYVLGVTRLVWTVSHVQCSVQRAPPPPFARLVCATGMHVRIAFYHTTLGQCAGVCGRLGRMDGGFFEISRRVHCTTSIPRVCVRILRGIIWPHCVHDVVL